MSAPPKLTLIAAMDNAGLIGSKGQLPWHAPEDLRFFRAQTLHRTIIMGRKTYDSIGHALPKRNNVVVTTQTGFEAHGCQVYNSIPAALHYAFSTDATPLVIGGRTLYEATITNAHSLLITRVEGNYEGDTYFPEFQETGRFELVTSEPCEADPRLTFQKWQTTSV